jgi:hypothetical protein
MYNSKEDKMKNKIPEYVIEELIPRFRGIDTPTIANVECAFLNMNGNFIMSKTSEPDYDKLHLNANDTMMGNYDIALCSNKAYREIKELYDDSKEHRYDETDGMLSTYHHSITTGMTYVTLLGFENHFKIRTLSKDFGIDIKKNYKFDKSKLKLNDVFEITIKYKTKKADIRYGILLSDNDTTLQLNLSMGFDEDAYKPATLGISIDDIINGTVTLERVDPYKSLTLFNNIITN